MSEQPDDGQDPTTIPWGSSSLYVILASSLMGVMGVSLISPVLPELRTFFAVSDAQIGLILTVYTLPGVFLTPFVGLVADRIGRRRVIIPLLFLFGASGAGIAVASNFTEVLILRFFQGVGASALVTLAVTLIGDVYEGGRRDTVMGFNASMLSSGSAIYPLIGGALAGVRWNVPFLFFGVGILVGIFALLTLPEPDGDQPSDVREYLGQLRIAATRPRAVAIYGAIFAIFFVFYGAIQTALPLLLDDTYGLSSGHIGLVLAMVAVASAVVSSQYGWISEWRTAPELVALGFVAAGASLLGVYFSQSPLSVGVSLLAFGVGFGIIMPSIDTAVITLVSNQLRAGMMGMRTSMLRLGQTLGPVSFTYVAGTAFPSPSAGYRFLLLLFGTTIVIGGILFYAILRR